MSKPFLGREWYDDDQAACALAMALGIYEPPDRTFGPAKWVFCSINPVGDAIYGLLGALVAAGIIESDGDGRYRSAGADPRLFSEQCEKARKKVAS